MEPIINPSLFYWLDLLGDFEITCVLVTIVLVIAIGIRAVYYVIEECDVYCGEEKPKLPKFLKITPWIISIALLFAILIPSKETIYTMLLAKQITPDNITQSQAVIKETADYIIDAIKEIKGESHE